MKKGVGVLILGVLGFGVSLYFIFSDGKKDITPVPDMPDQHIDERLVSNYHKETLSLQQNLKKDTNYSELTVALPKIFFGSGFISLAKEIQNTYRMKIKYIPVANLSIYTQLIKNSNIDIFLYPYDWSDSLTTRALPITQSLNTFFDPLVEYFILKKSFFPFLLDPAVFWKNPNKNINSSDLNAMITYNKFLKTNTQLSALAWDPNYDNFGTLLNHIRYTKNSNLFTALDNLYTITTTLTDEQKGFLEKIYTALKQKNKICNNYISLCLLYYSFTDAYYGYLSEDNIFGQLGDAHPDVLPYPYVSEGYPIRVWGFFMNDSSKKDKEVKIFLESILNTFDYKNISGIPAIVGEDYYSKLLSPNIAPITRIKDIWYIETQIPELVHSYLEAKNSNLSLAEYWNHIIGE